MMSRKPTTAAAISLDIASVHSFAMRSTWVMILLRPIATVH